MSPMPTKSRKARSMHGSPQKEESLESITLPDFLEPRRRLLYARLLKIRAKRLLDRDLTGALEAVCDLVADAYAASGRVLTEDSINGELAEATYLSRCRLVFTGQTPVRTQAKVPFIGEASRRSEEHTS